MIIEKHSRAPKIMRLLVFFVIVLGGCKSLPWNRSVPKLTFTSPTTGNKVEASGNAVEPAKVETEKRQTEIPLPPNSQISFVEAKKDLAGTVIEPAKTVVSVSAPTVLREDRSEERIQQAKAFAPPAPESSADKARGSGIRAFYFASLACGLLAFAMLYLQHYKAAGFAFLAAVVLPMVATFLGNSQAVLVGSVVLAISLTLFGAWYLVKNHPEIKTEALSELQSLKLEYEKLKTQIPKI